MGAYTAIRALERTSPSRDGVEIRWFRHWTDELERIHEALQGNDWLRPELLRILLENPGPHKRRIALLETAGRPWAMVPLRLCGPYWEPLHQGVTEWRPSFLAREREAEVLAALGLSIGCWDSAQSGAGWKGVRWRTRDVCYRLDLVSDPREHWRRTGLWKTIAQSRRRTDGFDLVINDEVAAEWTARQWGRRWSTGRPEEVASKWADRAAVSHWGLKEGTGYCWALRDGREWVSGLTAFVRDGELHLRTAHREARYGWHNVGHRLLYEACWWAYENGLRATNLGSGFDYKRRWATPSAVSWSFIISPLPVYLLQGATHHVGAAMKKYRRARR